MTCTRQRRRVLAGTVVLALLVAGCADHQQALRMSPAGPARVQPAPGQSYLALGRQLLAGGEPALALEAFTASLSLEGLSAEAMTGAGIAAQQQGLLRSARRYFERARDLRPDSVIAHNNLGVVLFMLEEYYGARDEFRAAWRLSGEQSEMARRNLDRAEEAIALIEAGEKLDPAYTYRVVRLGSDQFRLVKKPPAEDPPGEE